MLRYNSDGSLDTGFDGDGILASDVYGILEAMALQPDGKIVVVGDYMNQFLIVRLNADGSRDTDFGDNGVVSLDLTGQVQRATAVAIQPDGKMVVAGYYGDVPTRNYIVFQLHP